MRAPRHFPRISLPGRPRIEPLEARIAPALATPFPLGGLNGTNGFGITGPGQVGNDVSVVGDVNADGFDDLLVAVSANPGTAYVIFGKAGGFPADLDLAALTVADGFAVTAPAGVTQNFGLTAGGLGDVNGDGFADFAVGSAAEKIGANNSAGALYVIFGRANFPASLSAGALDGTDGFRLTGVDALGGLGTSIAPAGDLNGDGLAEFVVTASGADGGFSGKGAAYVIFGRGRFFSASLSVGELFGTNGFKVTGEAAKDFLSSAASAGDVNGDGFGDLILGAARNDATGKDAGAAYVLFGKAGTFTANVKLPSLSAADGFKLRGEVAGDYAGASVSSAGDLNGDGFGDLLIGAPFADRGAANTGAAYVVFGKAESFGKVVDLASLAGSTGFKLTGAGTQNHVGYAVSPAGDVDGDGFDDAIIAARAVGVGYGGAYVIYGKGGGFTGTIELGNLQEEEGFPITGTLGYRVGGAGDLNGDGLNDLVIGARDFDRSYVVFGFDRGTITHRGDEGATTLTGDANANIMVAGQAGDTLLGNGGADVLRGGEGDDVLAVGDLLFQSVHGGNGRDTLRLDGAGLVLNLTALPDTKLRGLEVIDLTGSGGNTLTLSKRDVLQLAPNSNTLTVLGGADDLVNLGLGWLEGSVQVIDGAPFRTFYQGNARLNVAQTVPTSIPSGVAADKLDGTGGLTVLGADTSDGIGRTVNTLGDVNGDGFDDFIIGAYSANPLGVQTGAAYVVFGKGSGLPAPLDLSLLDGTDGFRVRGTNQNSNFFATELGSAGDINNDGFADILISEVALDAGAVDAAGAVYVIFGKATFTADLNAPTLAAADGFRFSGLTALENVGSGVGAGDINGDGYDDLIIGAARNDSGGKDSGAAFVLFGKASGFTNLTTAQINGTNGFRINGNAAGDFLGVTASGAGDVNGDGFDDLLLGASQARPHGVNSGIAYVVFGKTNGFGAAVDVAKLKGEGLGFAVRGGAAGDFLGSAVGRAGDVNGDGFDDIVVGAPGVDLDGANYGGAAYVIFGKANGFVTNLEVSTLNGTDGFRIRGGGGYGSIVAAYAVGAAGDVNGDGFDDVLVAGTGLGAEGFSGANHAYVVFGGAALAPVVKVTEINGLNGLDLGTVAFVGGSASAAGDADLNGDGFDDVVLGGWRADAPGRSAAGNVFVVFGRDSGGITHPGDANVNTLTGTGSGDVLVAGQGNDTLLGQGGRDAFSGGQGDDLITVSDFNFLRVAGGSGLDTLRLEGSGLTFNLRGLAGTEIHGIERLDLTGSGANTLTLTKLDVVNLAPQSNTLTVLGDAGDRVNFGPGWTRMADTTIDGAPVRVFTSGAATLILSAAIEHPLPSGYALNGVGGFGLGFTLNGVAAGDFAGGFVSDAGDVNGDGFGDLVVGASRAAPHGVDSGAAYVVFGKVGGFAPTLELSALTGADGFTINGPAAGWLFGNDAAGADVNGDGFSDVIIGAYGADVNGLDSGAAYVIFGKAGPSDPVIETSSLLGSTGFTIIGAAAGDFAGHVVRNSGDVNGDGYTDLLVGADLADVPGKANVGKAYLIYGRATFPATFSLSTVSGVNGFTVAGTTATANLSAGLGRGGDVNGDGFADTVIGVPGATPNGKSSGQALVYRGGPVGTSLIGLSASGRTAFDYTGFSLSAAGDVNGDGLGDIIVTALGSDISAPNSGAAYVIFGKTSAFVANLAALGSSGFRILGGAAGDILGISASAAGDVNGDGFDDLIVGTSAADPAGESSGAAYIVYGKPAFADVNVTTLDGSNGFWLFGGAAGEGAGNPVSTAGDVNGDGFDDLIIGAQGATPDGRVKAGQAHVFFGFDSSGLSLVGTSGVDDLGPTPPSVIVGGAADDTLRASGSGPDVLKGGQGDDLLVLTGFAFRQFAGGSGVDTLRLNGAGYGLSLPNLSDTRLTGLEQIDIRGTGANSLVLNFREVVNLSSTSNTLVVQADTDDSVTIGPGWILQGNEFIGADSFQVFKQGPATLKLQEGSLAITLVNPTTATFTDVDGDLVTIKASKGAFSFLDFKVAPGGSVGGFQLQTVNFSDDGLEFQDANLTITAVRTALGGDGRVNLGYLNATGVDLGKVSIDGDLGQVDAGDLTLTTPGIDALGVGSMGLFGTSTQTFGASLESDVRGTLGALSVQSDLNSVRLAVIAPTGGMGFGAVTIGGSIISDTTSLTSLTGLFTLGSAGAIKIGGDLRGGPGGGGSILAFDIGGNIGSLSIGGSLAAGVNTSIGAINAGGTFGPITIGGDFDHTKISAVKGFTSITIAGSVLSSRVLAGLDLFEVPRNADATIGAVKVSGDWVASTLQAGVVSIDPFFGNGGDSLIPGGVAANIAKVTSIAIGGMVLGTVGGVDHFGFVAEEIGSFSVGGTKFPLVPKASNDLAGFYVGSTLDVKVREVNATVTPIDPPIGGGGGGGTPAPAVEFQLSALNGTNGFEFSGVNSASDTGRTVNPAGDVNNDGFGDFIVSSNGANAGAGVASGEAYVVFGKGSSFPTMFDANALDGTNGFRIQGNAEGMQLGLGAAGAGDFNNDGFDDVIVGGIILDSGGAGSDTSAFVIFGKASFTATPAINVGALNGSNGVELRAPHDSNAFVGFRMGASGAGDINQDGFADVIVGVTNADDTGQSSGAVYVVMGRANSAAALIDMGALTGGDGFRFDSGAGSINLGDPVSEAGDLNGDGIDDIVLGVPNENPAGGPGTAYVIFGRTTAFPATLGRSALDGTTGFRIFAEASRTDFGASVDAAGDVNGDGFDDLVVGAPYASINGEGSGATYVIYGKSTSVSGAFPADLGVASLNGSNGFRIVGESEYDYAGRVAGVGDVNGDGFDDIGIGALGAGTARGFIGNAYIVHGKGSFAASLGLETLTAATGRKFIGAAAGDQTGGSISAAGDVNNDGLADVLIGATRANSTAPNNGPGAAYLVFGTDGNLLRSLNGTNGFRFDGETGGTAGRSIAGVGDVNGDLIDDILIGAPGADIGGAQDAGEAYVIFGTRAGFDPTLKPADLNGMNGFRLFRGIASAQFGLAVGAAGDVNNDGFADIIVGQIESLGLGGSQTSAFVVFGKATPFSATLNVSTLNGTNGFAIHAPVNPRTSIQFRMGVSGAGDLNNDGRDDVILGVTNSDFNGVNSGSDYVFFSPAVGNPASLDGGALNGSNGFRFDGPNASSALGYSVSEAGDINGDGLDDLVLGVPNQTVAFNRQGAAYVIYGRTTAYPSGVLNTTDVMAGGGTLGFRILGAADFDITGASLDSAGDVNGDGFDDLVIGAPYADGPAQYSGAAYVIYGKLGSFGPELALAGLTASQGFRVSGEGKYDYAGRVGGAGDVNGDGFDDILIGAIGQEAEFEFKGAAYLIYGRAGAPVNINASSGVKFNGVSGADETGGSVGRAGDVNGDGRADLLIGADRADNGGNFSGSTYVVLNVDVGPTTGTAGAVAFSNGNKTATFTDVDGDVVMIKTTAGQFQQSDFTLLRAGNVGGAQLQKLDLSGAAHAAFAGASLTITAVRGAQGGDGFVNVGALFATDNDLGKVSIDGDLGQLDAGNGDPLKPAVAALTVQSLGRLGLSTQAAAGASLESNIAGKLGAFTVKSDIAGAFVNIAGSANDGDDDSGAVTIGGSIRGGVLANSGSLFAAGDLGAVKIGGSVIGGAGVHSGSVEAGVKIGSVSIDGALLGGTGAASGSLIAGTALGAVKVGGDLSGGRIFAQGNLLPTSAALALAIKSLAIEGTVNRASILAGFDRDGAPANADAQIGAVSVGRDWLASSLSVGVQSDNAFFGDDDTLIPGGNATIARIASISIAGQAHGTVVGGDHFGFVAQEIGGFKIGTTVFPLAKGAPENLPVGATGDLRLRET